MRLATSDFYDSTGEFSKYRKTLTYKICDAVHTCPPQIARPVYVKCEQISSDLRPGEVWCGQGISVSMMTFFIDVNNTVTSSFTYVNNTVTWILNGLFLTIVDDDDGKSIECSHEDIDFFVFL